MFYTHHFTRYLLLAGCVLALGGAPSAQAGPSIKCWTNDDGVKECGTVMPPEYAPKGHQVISPERGVVKEIGPQKTPEEIAELMRKAAEEKAREEAEKQRLAEGKALLDAYPTETDIILARDGKLASVDAAIQVAENQIQFFQRSLQEAENAVKIQPSEELKKHIANLKDQIEKFKQIVKDKHQEKKRIHQEYEVILKKYRDYKAFLSRSRITGQSTEGGERKAGGE